jgi:hypothetical protein
MGFLAALVPLAAGLSGGSAIAAGAGAGSVAAGTAAGAATGIGSALSGTLAAAGTAATIYGALSRPKPPALAPPPQLPTFAAGLRGNNPSLVGQSPLSALGGTVTGPFGTPSGQGKTLLGQ